MLVSAMIVGERPDFAVNSYMVLDQEGRTIKPLTARADGQAEQKADYANGKKTKVKQPNYLFTHKYIIRVCDRESC